MKHLLLLCILLITIFDSYSQKAKKGKVVTEKFIAPSLQGNKGGENPLRSMTIYLPSGYETSKQHYPTLYFLHGFLVNDSLMMVWNQLNDLLDSAISSGQIQPIIVILPNSDNNYGGSFYTNSSLMGNWADYIAKDVVAHIDRKYRTLKDKNSRGLAGHSMGGNGALKIGMQYADIFGVVYALSPAVLGWGEEFSLQNPAFKDINSFNNEYGAKEIFAAFDKGDSLGLRMFHTKVFAALARAYSPDEKANFISASLPVSYRGDSLVINQEIEKQWQANFPINMIESYLPALRKLNALKLDWGRDEENRHIPCLSPLNGWSDLLN